MNPQPPINGQSGTSHSLETVPAMSQIGPAQLDDTLMPTSSAPNLYYRQAGKTAAGVAVPNNVVLITGKIPGTLNWLLTTPIDNVAKPGGAVCNSGNNIITAGLFQGTVIFDGQPMGRSLTSNGGTDIFIAQYTQPGVLTSLFESFGTTTDDAALAMAIDSVGNIVVCGVFTNTINFGNGTVPLTSAGGKDIFVAKFTPAGLCTWAKRCGGSQDDFGNGIAIDSADNVFMVGYGSGTIDYDGSALSLYPGGGGIYDIILVKINGSTGAKMWGKLLGQTGYNFGAAITVDPVNLSGNVTVVGQWGGGSLSGLGAPSGTASTGALIASYLATDGTYQWSKVATGDNNNFGLGATTDRTGNVYWTGSFNGSADFGGGSVTTINGGGIFVMAYNSSGVDMWPKAKAYGGPGDAGNAVALDGNGVLAVTGKSGWGSDFTGTGIYTTGSGYFLLLLTAITTNPVYKWHDRTGSGVGGAGTCIAIDKLGNITACGFFNGTGTWGGTFGHNPKTATADQAPSLYSAFFAQYIV